MSYTQAFKMSSPKGTTMGIDDLKKYADKAKGAVSDNRDRNRSV
jgi:hypothetical protein